jgi:hypothetical protein
MPVVLTFFSQALRNEEAGVLDSHDAVGFPPYSRPEWDILRKFFDQSWFIRVWTVQEAVAANKAVIIVGDWELDWEMFRKVTL